MKQLGKSVFVLIAIVCVAVFCIGFLGISSTYGDISTDIVNNVHKVPRGFGFEKEFSLYLAVDSESDAEIDYASVKHVLEKRLELSSAVEYEVYPDVENRGMYITVPFDSIMEENFIPLARILASTGKVEVRVGKEADENGKPIGDADSVILTNEQIATVIPRAYTESKGSVVYYLEFLLTKAGQDALQKRSHELVDSAVANETPYVSVWIDDALIDYYGASQLFEAEIITASSGAGTGYTLDEVSVLAVAISGGHLDAPLLVQKLMSVDNAGFAGANNYQLMVFSFGAVLLLIGVFLIVRYRLIGLSGFISILGSLGLMFFVLTSFYGYVASMQVTTAVFAAFLVMLMAFSWVVIRDGESIKAQLIGGNSVSKSLGDGFKKNTASSIVMFVALFLGGLLVSDLFKRDGGWLSIAIRWIVPSFTVQEYFTLGHFGTIILVGAIFGLILMVLINRLMVKSLLGFDAFRKSSSFGGPANEKL